jgi:hypothetical protein
MGLYSRVVWLDALASLPGSVHQRALGDVPQQLSVVTQLV